MSNADPGDEATLLERRVSSFAEARQAELEVGSLRGRIAEFETQIDRAEQDVELGWWHWRRRSATWVHARRRRGTVSGPLVSVLTPVYETEADHLRACLASVAAQTYRDWEHVLVDDGSRTEHVRTILDRAAAADRRVRVVRCDVNRGIVASSQTALSTAGGEFVALLDHDDELAPEALERLVAALRREPAAALAYSDNDRIDADGRLVSPFYKPDFAPEHLRNQNYVLHCVLARRRPVEEVGGFRAGFDGAQDHDLVLRLSERAGVLHVPEVLYHWRQSATSVAAATEHKPYAFQAGVRAVREHCDRVGLACSVEPGADDGAYRVRHDPPADLHLSVVIPTRGATGRVWGVERTHVLFAVSSIVERSALPAGATLEFVVVASPGTPADVLDGALRAAGDHPVTVVGGADGPFNFSMACNAGAAASRGALLLFLNDDTELIEPASIVEMAGLAGQRDVALVGAKLLYGDGRLQHGGHVYPGLATHALLGYPGDHPGPYRMLLVARECSGVTAAAMMVSAARFAELGGFDDALPLNFNDVDLSLRARRAGYRNVWTPHASWYHFESISRDPATGAAERELILARWRSELDHDPYFNPNLATHRSDWLERPGRSGAPPYYRDAEGHRRFS